MHDAYASQCMMHTLRNANANAYASQCKCIRFAMHTILFYSLIVVVQRQVEEKPKQIDGGEDRRRRLRFPINSVLSPAEDVVNRLKFRSDCFNVGKLIPGGGGGGVYFCGLAEGAHCAEDGDDDRGSHLRQEVLRVARLKAHADDQDAEHQTDVPEEKFSCYADIRIRRERVLQVEEKGH